MRFIRRNVHPSVLQTPFRYQLVMYLVEIPAVYGYSTASFPCPYDLDRKFSSAIRGTKREITKVALHRRRGVS